MMRIVNVRVCLSVVSLLGLGLFVPEAQAVGPAVAQQTMTQIQGKLTEASVGWRHWRRGWGYGGWGRRGWGYGGWGYGGWGYRGLGYYGGWGGYRGLGYGGWGYPYYGYSYGYPYYGGYSGFGGYYGGYYPSYYSYATPYSYSYAAPSYASAYTYASPSTCCGSSYSQPYYGVSNYSYGTQPVYASSYSTPAYTASTPVYSAPSAYGTSTYNYGNTIYTPSSVSPTVISSPSVVYPSSNGSQAPAPYPAPPIDIQQPSTYHAPIAAVPGVAIASETPVTEYIVPARTAVAAPVYSPTFAYTGVATAIPYSSTSYVYQPTSYRPSTLSALSRMSAGIVW